MKDLIKIIGLLLISLCTSAGSGVLAYAGIKLYPDALLGLVMVAGFISPIFYYINKLIKEK